MDIGIGTTLLRSARSALNHGRIALALAAMTLFLAACDRVGTDSITFWDVMLSMIVFFFWFMLIWVWIGCLADLFRRTDLSGGWKAVWVLIIIFLPLLGCLIYLIARPKVTAQDVQLAAQAEAAQKAVAGVSTADELAKLQSLKDAGTLSAAEFEDLKKKLLA